MRGLLERYLERATRGFERRLAARQTTRSADSTPRLDGILARSAETSETCRFFWELWALAARDPAVAEAMQDFYRAYWRSHGRGRSSTPTPALGRPARRAARRAHDRDARGLTLFRTRTRAPRAAAAVPRARAPERRPRSSRPDPADRARRRMLKRARASRGTRACAGPRRRHLRPDTAPTGSPSRPASSSSASAAPTADSSPAIDDVGRAFGALAVEHRAVRRQRAVDRELLRGRARAPPPDPW